MAATDVRRTGSEGSRTASPRSRGGHVLVVDDDEVLRRLLRDTLEDAGHDVTCVGDGQAALEALATALVDVVLLDLHLPRVSGLNVLSALPSLDTDARFIVMTAFGTVGSAVEAMKLGAFDYVEKPVEAEHLLHRVRRALDDVELRRELHRLREGARDGEPYGMVGRSAPMLRLYRQIDRVAPTRANVLITGETGSGKELVARAIHDLSPRAGKPFVPVNCSALPESLLESELFGHLRGSFTGAVQSRRGLVEEAAGGTLFLDEVSTLSSDTQVKLLRVVEDRRVRRIGGGTPVPVDFRLVAATNQDLAARVREGEFREDLWFRLNVFPIRVPPLRARTGDIPLLTRHFRRKYAEEDGVDPPPLGPRTLARMMEYPWPGNVRELENFVERSVILYAGEGSIPFDPPSLELPVPGRADTLMEVAREERWTLERLEREYILAVLDQVRWQQGTAARILGVNRRTVYRKLKRYREEGHIPDADADVPDEEEAS